MIAYLGPGGAVTAVGAAVALLATVVAAFFGVVWYPIKRVLRWWHDRRRGPVSGSTATVGRGDDGTGTGCS